ncbi:MAG: cell division protein FtsA [Candidatus Pacebacteria bacterium]|nr:cell division protein FtsA [Candidatus Paceibacterota bacterium]
MSKKNKSFLALDIGSFSIKALYGELSRDNVVTVMSLWKIPSRGMRRGAVNDADETAGAVNQMLCEAQAAHPNEHPLLFVGIAGAQAKAQSSRGIVAVSRADNQIQHDDVARVDQAAQAVAVPANRSVIHFIHQEYAVDGVTGIKNPLGMVGNRLELASMVIDVFEPAKAALMRAVEVAGGDVAVPFFGPLASSQSVLSKNQRDLGVALVDIGADVTSLAVYEEGKLLHVASVPMGSGNVTNDVAIGLKISIAAAEAVKCSFGYALAKDVPVREAIDLQKMDARAKGAVPRRYVAEIIEARMAEIFEFIVGELKKIKKDGLLPAGVVLVGGGAKLAGITDLARQELRLPVQVGMPDISRIEVSSGDVALKLEDPEYACAVGLALAARDSGHAVNGTHGGTKAFFAKLVNYFMP